MQQLKLSLDLPEPMYYHDQEMRGYFALLLDKEDGKIQRSYDLAQLAIVLSLLDKTRDSWISQAEFFAKTRRIVHLLRLGVLFVDLDTYKIPHMRGLTPDQQVATLLYWCEQEGIPYPSVVVFSGRGLQAKWLLDGSLPRQALPRWNSVQRYLVEALKELGADHAAKDASRVLRLVNTVNTKSGEMVYVVHVTEAADGLPIRYGFEYMAEAILPKARWDIEKERKKPKLKSIQGSYAGGLVALNRSRLNWDRLEDLRRLAELRGGVAEGGRMLMLHWQLNFLLLSGATHSRQMHFEAAALAREINPAWPYRPAELSTLYRKAQAYNAGEKVEFAGKQYPPLYTPKNQHLIDLFSITDDEQRQLQTIITPAMAAERHAKREVDRRAKAGAIPRAEYEANSANKQERAKQLRSTGMSIRAIADAMGVSKSQVARYLC